MKQRRRAWFGIAMPLLLLCAFTAHAKETLQAYEETAEAIAQGFTERDTSAFNEAIDADAIIATALDSLTLDAGFKREFSKGLKSAIEEKIGLQFTTAMPDGAYAKILRVKRDGGVSKALLRVDMGDAGNVYMDLYLKRDKAGKVRIVDWFDYSAGQPYSASLEQFANMASPTPTIIGRIYDRVTDNKKNQDAFMAMFNANKLGEHARTVELFLAMDEEMLKSRVINMAAIRAAQQSGDDELYVKTLAVLDKYHGDDPTLTFILLDYHFIKENYSKVISSLNYLEKTFGVEDAALKAMIANAHLESGNYDAAIKAANSGIELEPEYENGYWSLMTAQLLSENFSDAVVTAKILENTFSYDLSPESIGENEVYAGLLQSEAYKRWRAEGS